MAGFDVSRLLGPEGIGAALVRGGDRLEEVADVVAQVDTGEHAPDEDVVDTIEHRDTARPGAPGPLGQLVDLVGGLAPEQLGQIVLVGGNQVHGEHRGGLGDAVRAVLDGQADEESGRVDRALGGEAD